MKKQIKMQDFKSLIKEGVAKLHRKTLLENRIKQINEELEMLEYDENDLPPNSADDFDVNGGDKYNKKRKQIIPFNDEEINKLQQIGAKKQHSNAIFFELIDKYYIYKLSDGSYELYEESLGWEPEMGGKGYNSIYFKSLDNLIRKIEPEIEKYKEKKGIEAEREKAQEERRKAQDWEDFQNRGKLPGVTDLGYNIDLSKFKDNKNRFINKKPNTISELRQIIRESLESLGDENSKPNIDFYISNALAVKPKRFDDIRTGVSKYEKNKKYPSYHEYHIEGFSFTVDFDDYSYTLLLECRVDTGEYIMHFHDESMVSPDWDDEINKSMEKYLNSDCLYFSEIDGFENDIQYSLDITNELSSDTKKKISYWLDELSDYVDDIRRDSDEDDNMSDSEFHSWANPRM